MKEFMKNIYQLHWHAVTSYLQYYTFSFDIFTYIMDPSLLYL